MCLTIDPSITSLNKRVVWKIFDKDTGKIASLFRGVVYPKGKLIERSKGDTKYPNTTQNLDGSISRGFMGTRGLHFYTSKKLAQEGASLWNNAYIAKFAVNPKDFMYADKGATTAMYERAIRTGNFIKVKPAG